jgi:O-antigen/teichoic acid export membrane protein
MKQKAFNLIKDTLLFALGSIGSKLILFFMVPIYTNFLTEAEYGISELVFSSAQLLIPLLSLVIFDAVVRFGVSKEGESKDVLLIGLLVFTAGSILTVAITPLFGLYSALSKWKWYMCVYIIFNMLCAVLGSYIKAVNKNKLYATVSILQTLVMALLNVLFLMMWDIGVRGYLLSTILASAVAAASFFLLGGIGAELKTAHFRPELLKKMVAFSAPLIITLIFLSLIPSCKRFSRAELDTAITPSLK